MKNLEYEINWETGVNMNDLIDFYLNCDDWYSTNNDGDILTTDKNIAIIQIIKSLHDNNSSEPDNTEIDSDIEKLCFKLENI